MPLLKGKENVGHNIAEMEAAGHPREQAIAAALRTAGVYKKTGRYRKAAKKIRGTGIGISTK